MATPALTKIERMHFRLPQTIKERIEKAAIVSGQTLTDFAVSVLASSAEQVLERNYITTLSDRDRDRFLAMIDADSEPNAALLRAAEAHQRLIAE